LWLSGTRAACWFAAWRVAIFPHLDHEDEDLPENCMGEREKWAATVPVLG
jgi:hypothetical protein